MGALETNRMHVLLFVAVLAASVGCDQVSKSVAREVLAGQAPMTLALDTVRLELVGNPGGFLGLGAQLPERVRSAFFVVGIPLILAALCVQLVRSGLRGRLAAIALALLVGGGLGNWIDRVLHAGVVTDFVRLGVGPLRTGVFNGADVAVMAGAGLLVWMSWRAEPAESGSIAESD